MNYAALIVSLAVFLIGSICIGYVMYLCNRLIKTLSNIDGRLKKQEEKPDLLPRVGVASDAYRQPNTRPVPAKPKVKRNVGVVQTKSPQMLEFEEQERIRRMQNVGSTPGQ